MAKMLRAQAAMEYLVTYGWALLALFAVVAFLVGSGVFSSNSFTNQDCSFQPDLPCPYSIMYVNNAGTNTTLQFSLVNGLGFPINVTNVTYTVTDIGPSGRSQVSVPVSMGAPSGAYMNFNHTFGGPIVPGARTARQVLVSISYKNCKASPCTPLAGTYTTTGRISALVQQG